MKIQHIPGVAPLYTNTFLIVTDAGHGIIVDAAAAPQTYLDALQAEQAQLTHILLTHGHYDHVGAVGIEDRRAYVQNLPHTGAHAGQRMPALRGIAVQR